jgi:hypothetical protein
MYGKNDNNVKRVENKIKSSETSGVGAKMMWLLAALVLLICIVNCP